MLFPTPHPKPSLCLASHFPPAAVCPLQGRLLGIPAQTTCDYYTLEYHVQFVSHQTLKFLPPPPSVELFSAPSNRHHEPPVQGLGISNLNTAVLNADK